MYMKMYLIHVLCYFRSLGVHVSKVRSLILDAWEPEQVKVHVRFNKVRSLHMGQVAQ